MQSKLYFIALDASLAAELEAGLGAARDALRRLGTLQDFEALLDQEPRASLVVAVADAAQIDMVWWRRLRARAPQVQMLIVCRVCTEESWRRWLAAG
jgi:hypothetical protein